MALEYESNPNLVGAIKVPFNVLGADKNYRQALYETIAEQVEGLGRRPNANYNVGEVVYPSSNLKYALTCTTAGTSDAADLNISTNTEGDTITDGTVTWKVVKRNYLGSDGVLPIAKGGTGANTAEKARENLGLATVASTGSYNDLSNRPSIPATPSDYIVEQAINYKKWNSGILEMWGYVAAGNASEYSTGTFPVALASTSDVYINIGMQSSNTTAEKWSGASYGYTSITTTTIKMYFYDKSWMDGKNYYVRGRWK